MNLYQVQPGRVYDPKDGSPLLGAGAVVELDEVKAAPWVAQGVLALRRPSIYPTRVMRPDVSRQCRYF